MLPREGSAGRASTQASREGAPHASVSEKQYWPRRTRTLTMLTRTTSHVAVPCRHHACRRHRRRQLDAFGLTINPKPPVVDFTWCDPICNDPSHYYDQKCNYCLYNLPNYPNTTYSVPQNVFAMDQTSAGECYDQITNNEADDYENLVGHSTSHGGWFHSSSKTTTTFYGMQYRYYMSLSLEYKFLIWHSVTLFPNPQLTFNFARSLDLLPSTYDNETYTRFISEWGTHYMDSAFMGGSALMNNYFHSCFTEQYGGHYIYKQSSSSFFGLFKSSSKASSGFNHTDPTYKTWSNTTIKLIGGNAGQHATLNWTDPMDKDDVQAWEDSIHTNMSPLQYTFKPLSALITDATKAANVEHALTQYGASIKEQQDALVNSIVPDPTFKKPAWCKFDPKPPVAEQRNPLLSRNLQSGGALPGCPSLPGSDDAVAMTSDRRRLSLEE